jgi:SAM-dependent MidA family methyltransferase
MNLEQIIIKKIKDTGPVSFLDYMEMALYYPELGYYHNDKKQKIGIHGDFYTSSHYTVFFGQMLAIQIEQMWQALDHPSFTIVEYGAGTGYLCRDILHFLEQHTMFYKSLRYIIIEKSTQLKKIQQQQLEAFSCISWVDNIAAIGIFKGCVLSNELLDNFSVHRVRMEEDELKEIWVDHENKFIETFQPATELLKNYFKELDVELPVGYQAEINVQAVNWISEISNSLDKGFVITIDYGHPSRQLYSKPEGTLRCYYQHSVNNFPYQYIGSQDITSDINFSALANWGLKNKLLLNGFTQQAYFLQSLGLCRQVQTTGSSIPAADFIRTFMLDMGTKLKVMIQEKNTSLTCLSGLKFCQPLRF